MLSNLVSMITKQLASSQTSSVNRISAKPYSYSSQKENVNPFLSTSYGSASTYGKNQPVAGGYFAGYYNGKPNIVGRKLFIEV